MDTRAKTKSLAELGLTLNGTSAVRVSGLTSDSRNVADGMLFAALPGSAAHGASFVDKALAARLGAVLTDRAGAESLRARLGADVPPLVVAEDPRQALAFSAALWFEGQPEIVVAVTGTNGKTSVTTFARQLWQTMHAPAINIGTTGVEGAWSAPARHTTPDPITLQRLLSEAAAEGVTHAAMEASSHGLDQRRLDGVRLAAAAFTNFSQDHLDYHESFEAYFAAKAALFDRVLTEDGTAVVNIDDPRGKDIVEIADDRGQELLTIGREEAADLQILGQRFEATGQILRFRFDDHIHQVRLGLMGGFQAENALVAAGLCIATGSDPAETFAAMEKLETVRGRMQMAAIRDNGASVFVDYAHTPDALATALAAMRPHVLGRLHVVFGAGGDRDMTKRPLMGRAAAENADVVTVTDDNPRSEAPEAIRAMVLDGAKGRSAELQEIGDRAEAILRAVDALEPGDALLVAGKGHETGQIIGDSVLPFDDVEHASVAVAALDGRGV